MQGGVFLKFIGDYELTAYNLPGRGDQTFKMSITKDIMANTDLGISHVYDERFPDNYIRLPLGAFINHHEMPNCNAIVSESHESIGKIKHIRIVADKDILSGEKITLNYIIKKLDNPLWEFEYEVSQ